MTFTAIAFLLIAAIVHAWWNLLGKQRQPSAVFFLVAGLSAAIALSPLLLVYRQVVLHIPTAVWLLLAATGVCQAIYYIGLAWAYRLGHLSVAYPLARATPVLLVAAINLLIGRSAQIGSVALAGMGVIGLGCVLLPMRRFDELKLGNYLHVSSLMALVAAIGTCGYSLVDSEALRQLRTYPPTAISPVPLALLYLLLEMFSTSVVMAVYVSLSRLERGAWRQLDRPGLLRAAGAGLLIATAYGLALASMAYVTNVSYVVAFRQISIPIGAMLGITILNEPGYAPKLAGVTILLAGLLMVAMG